MRQETPQEWRHLELEMIALKKDVDENRGKLLFQLFFLKDNENQSVEIEEVEEIDFRGVKERLEQGESVFITRKCKQKLNSNVIVSEKKQSASTLLTSREANRMSRQLSLRKRRKIHDEISTQDNACASNGSKLFITLSTGTAERKFDALA
jgi:hypothetical protein